MMSDDNHDNRSENDEVMNIMTLLYFDGHVLMLHEDDARIPSGSSTSCMFVLGRSLLMKVVWCGLPKPRLAAATSSQLYGRRTHTHAHTILDGKGACRSLQIVVL